MSIIKSTAFSLILATGVALGGFTGLEPTGLVAPTAAEAHGKGPQSDLRLMLNQLLAEHATLAAAATGAALGGRTKEFKAAADALDMNSQDIARAIGSVYGEPAGEAFLPLWRKHIGFFVDYTMATAKGSAKGQKKAVNDLAAMRKAGQDRPSDIPEVRHREHPVHADVTGIVAEDVRDGHA